MLTHLINPKLCSRIAVSALLLSCACQAYGQDSLSVKPERRGFLKRLGHGMYEFVKDFSRVDTNYVEPQHYNYTVMLQNTIRMRCTVSPPSRVTA